MNQLHVFQLCNPWNSGRVWCACASRDCALNLARGVLLRCPISTNDGYTSSPEPSQCDPYIYLQAPSYSWFFGNYEIRSIQTIFIDQFRAVDLMEPKVKTDRDITNSESNNVAILSSIMIINLAHIYVTRSSSTWIFWLITAKWFESLEKHFQWRKKALVTELPSHVLIRLSGSKALHPI